jgi:glucose repression mediator protein
MNEYDKAAAAYEYSLRHNPFNVETLTAIANILNKKQMYGKAAEYLQRAVKADPNNGEAWAALAYTVRFPPIAPLIRATIHAFL